MIARRFILAVLATGMTAAGGGCTKKLFVDRYPVFYEPRLKTVAVLPFDSASRQRQAGAVLSHSLAAALSANGTYKIVGPMALRGKLGAEKLEELVQASNHDVARALSEMGGIDAFVTGTALAYEAHTAGYLAPDYYRAGYGYGAWGGGGYGYRRGRYYGRYYGPVYDYEYVAEARVMLTAALVRTADATVLATTPVPIGCQVSLAGPAPTLASYALDRSTVRVMDEVVARFAVVAVEIKLKPGEDFRVTSGRRGDTRREVKEFATGEEEMAVWLRLPPEADRNEFEILLTTKDNRRRILATEKFRWSRGDGERTFRFSPKRLAAEAGPGEFRVRFIHRGKEIMHRDFRIRDRP